jgi:hypothetical protein
MEKTTESEKTHGKEASYSFKLYDGLIYDLHNLGIYSIWDVKKENMDEIRRTLGKYQADLGMEEEKFIEWEDFVELLK